MAIGTAAAVLGTVAAGAISSSVQSNAASKAGRVAADASLQGAQIQADAANRATDLQGAIYADQRNLLGATGRLGAGALARQARMAGLSADEARGFYNDQVTSLNAPFSPTSQGGGTYVPPQQQTVLGPGGMTYQQDGPITQQPAPTQNMPQAQVDYAAQDLGNLDEFAPQTFQFTEQDLYADPSYGFRVEQGQKALERSAAARGQLFSGATGQALQDYGQNMASTEYDNAYRRAFNSFQVADTNKWNRLGALSGAGADAQAQQLAAGANYAQGASQTIQQGAAGQAAGVRAAGAARASGYQGAGEAWGGFWGDTVPGGIGVGAGKGWFG